MNCAVAELKHESSVAFVGTIVLGTCALQRPAREGKVGGATCLSCRRASSAPAQRRRSSATELGATKRGFRDSSPLPGATLELCRHQAACLLLPRLSSLPKFPRVGNYESPMPHCPNFPLKLLCKWQPSTWVDCRHCGSSVNAEPSLNERETCFNPWACRLQFHLPIDFVPRQ